MTDNYIKKTSIPGLLVIERPTFPDNRGFFREIFRLNDLEAEIGREFKIVQANHAHSLPKVIRGLHAEDWNKLVYAVSGNMFIAIADIRPDSPTFGKRETFRFTADTHQALFLSRGLANSVCVEGDEPVDYLYLVDAYYSGSDTRAIAWDDPDLAIDWPVKDPIISDRDKNNPKLREMFPEKFK